VGSTAAQGLTWQNPEEDVKFRIEAAKKIAQVFKRGATSRDERREYRVLVALEALCYQEAASREEYTNGDSFEILLHRVASEKAKRRRESGNSKTGASFQEMLRFFLDEDNAAFGSTVGLTSKLAASGSRISSAPMAPTSSSSRQVAAAALTTFSRQQTVPRSPNLQNKAEESTSQQDGPPPPLLTFEESQVEDQQRLVRPLHKHSSKDDIPEDIGRGENNERSVEELKNGGRVATEDLVSPGEPMKPDEFRIFLQDYKGVQEEQIKIAGTNTELPSPVGERFPWALGRDVLLQARQLPQYSPRFAPDLQPGMFKPSNHHSAQGKRDHDDSPSSAGNAKRSKHN